MAESYKTNARFLKRVFAVILPRLINLKADINFLKFIYAMPCSIVPRGCKYEQKDATYKQKVATTKGSTEEGIMVYFDSVFNLFEELFMDRTST